MTKREIVNQYLIDSKLIEDCIYYQCFNSTTPYEREELTQLIWLSVLEYDEDRLFEMYEQKHLNAFLTSMIRRQVFSNTSPFYVTYRKKANNTLPLQSFYNPQKNCYTCDMVDGYIEEITKYKKVKNSEEEEF